MKKIVSIILVVVITLTEIFCLGMATYAYGEVEAINFTPYSPIKVDENYRYECECWNTDCTMCDGFYYEYAYGPDLWSGTLTVYYSDGSVVEYYGDGTGNYCADDGRVIYSHDITIVDNQWDTHWNSSDTYYVSVQYAGCAAIVPITLVIDDSDDDSDEVVSDLVVDEEYTVPSGTTKIFIPEESGYYRFKSDGYGDPKITITCLGGEYSFDDDVDSLDFDGTVYLEKGEEVSCYLYNYEAEDCVFVITNIGISDLVVNEEYIVPSGTTKTFIPEETGYYKFVSNGYGDPKITINCLDGEYSFDDDNGFDFNGRVYLEAGEIVSCYLYNYENEDCVFTITKDINEDILERGELVAISFDSDEPLTLVKNTGGRFITVLDEETWDEEEYYLYDIEDCISDGVLTLTYENGEEERYVYDTVDIGYTDTSGTDLTYSLYCYFNNENDDIIDICIRYTQTSESKWDVGTHYFTISRQNIETSVPVTIVNEDSGDEPDDVITDLVINEEYIVPSDTTKTFIPEETGYYRFASNGYGDPRITISCLSGNYSFDDNNGWDFDGTVYLEAGEIVSCDIFNYEDEDSVFTITKITEPESISVNLVEPIELTENLNGYWEYFDEESLFIYDIPDHKMYSEGSTITLNYADGTSDVYTCDGEEYKNSSGSELEFKYTFDQSLENPWLVGSDNYFTINILGAEAQVPVTIVRNLVESISYTSAKSGSWLKEKFGDYDYYYDYILDSEIEWFRYIYSKWQGDILTINFVDGTKEEYIYNGDDYISVDGDLIYEYDVDFSDNQSYTNQWTLGNSYEFTVSYAGKETTVPITIVELESYSFTLAEPLVLYKGHHLNDEGYFIDVYEDGNILTMHYSDGNKTDYIFGFNENQGYSGWFNESGESLYGYIDVIASGSENWDIGEHTAIVTYDNYEDEDKYEMEIEVSLIENPVESISVNLSGAIEFTEGEDSYFYTDSKGNLYNKYSPCQWDIPYGSTLTLNYKDGSDEVYILNEVWFEEDMQYSPEFVTADGKMLRGYDWYVDSDEETNHWSVGENYLTLSVYGVTTKLPVLVKENNVESFSIDYGNEIVYEQGTNGWTEFDYVDKDSGTYSVEYHMYKYWLGENGWELTVNYKDGTSDTYVCSVFEDYETGSSTQWRNASGDYLDVVWASDQSCDNQWGIGTHYVSVGCLGKIMQIPIEIVANENCSHSYMNGFCTVCKEEDPSHTIQTLSVGESKTATITNSEDSYYFYFTPVKSGVYSFSVPYDGGEYSQSPFAVVYDSNFTGIKSRVRWGSGYEEIYNYFEAGKKYIIKCGYKSSYDTGSFEISCDYDFYAGEGTNIIENYMFIPCFKTAVSDFVTVSDEIELDCTASFVTATSNYYGTGSIFRYSIGENTPDYTIIVEGDLNGDSVCDVLDAAAAHLYSAGFYEPSVNETYAANGDLIDEFDVNSYQNVVNCALS